MKLENETAKMWEQYSDIKKAEVRLPTLPEEHGSLSEISFPRGMGFNLHPASRNNSVKYHKASKSSGAGPGPRLTHIGFKEKESDN